MIISAWLVLAFGLLNFIDTRAFFLDHQSLAVSLILTNILTGGDVTHPHPRGKTASWREKNNLTFFMSIAQM